MGLRESTAVVDVRKRNQRKLDGTTFFAKHLIGLLDLHDEEMETESQESRIVKRESRLESHHYRFRSRMERLVRSSGIAMLQELKLTSGYLFQEETSERREALEQPGEKRRRA